MNGLRTAFITVVFITEFVLVFGQEGTAGGYEGAGNTTLSRITRNPETGRGMEHDYEDVDKPKSKPWLGYYDFLITEGSYKFWVVFQLFTIGILIYSAFAAVYYAKYTINDYDNYEDYLLRRSARWVPPTQTRFLGLPIETYTQIFNAIANYNDKYT